MHAVICRASTGHATGNTSAGVADNACTGCTSRMVHDLGLEEMELHLLGHLLRTLAILRNVLLHAFGSARHHHIAKSVHTRDLSEAVQQQ